MLSDSHFGKQAENFEIPCAINKLNHPFTCSLQNVIDSEIRARYVYMNIVSCIFDLYAISSAFRTDHRPSMVWKRQNEVQTMYYGTSLPS